MQKIYCLRTMIRNMLIIELIILIRPVVNLPNQIFDINGLYQKQMELNLKGLIKLYWDTYKF